MNTNIGTYMTENQKRVEGVLKNITPKIMRQELRDNFTDVERYLRFNGIYMTNNGKIPLRQAKKALELLKKKIQYKTMTLEEFAKLLD